MAFCEIGAKEVAELFRYSASLVRSSISTNARTSTSYLPIGLFPGGKLLQ